VLRCPPPSPSFPQGLAGEYGVTKNHSPVISELKAGVVQIVHEPVRAYRDGASPKRAAVALACMLSLPARRLPDINRLPSNRPPPQGQAPEKYFVSGGFALTHANSVTDIAVVEAAKLEDIDPEAVPKIYAEAVKDLNAAPEVRQGGRRGGYGGGLVGSPRRACGHTRAAMHCLRCQLTAPHPAPRTTPRHATPQGSKEKVEAQIEVEVAKSLAGALGVPLV